MQLEIRNIHKSFDGKEILHGISFLVESGRASGFLGRNGAGKSTTFRCLMQVFRQDEGEFLLDGSPLNLHSHRIGYLPEERGMYSKVTLKNQLMYFARLKGATRHEAEKDAAYWIHYFDLDEYADRKLETLSKGNQQKIQIAQAFLHDPDLIILDEPFSGLDPVNAQIFKDAIREMVGRGKLVIFSSHQMSYVEEICDAITIIDAGRILLSGELDEIKEREGRGLYQIECRPEAQEHVLCQINEAGLTCTLHGPKILTDLDPQKLPQLLADNFGGILDAGCYRPSLQDIFIAKAGEQDA